MAAHAQHLAPSAESAARALHVTLGQWVVEALIDEAQLSPKPGLVDSRGKAQAGCPHVIELGLPELRQSRARGDGETAARLNSLLAIMSRLDDTCVLSRGGLGTLAQLQGAAAAVLAAGGAATLPGRRAL